MLSTIFDYDLKHLCFQDEPSGPPSPQLDQQRMLRNVLLKAVENLRRSQNREQGKEVGEKQQEEELQLPKTNQRVDEMEANCDNAEERIESTKSISKKNSTNPSSQQEDSPEKATKGKKHFVIKKVFIQFIRLFLYICKHLFLI